MMNITYFQVTGTPLQPGNYCYGSRRRNIVNFWFQAIRDSITLHYIKFRVQKCISTSVTTDNRKFK